MSEPKKITVATTWLDGCSGCHMSLLDIDERLIELAQRVDVVYSPLVDGKHLPETVDVGIIEGSVSNEEDLVKAREFRQHCKFLISLGDCAVNGNVPAMRNLFPLDSVYDRAYKENVQLNPSAPTTVCLRCWRWSSRSMPSCLSTCTCRVARPPPIPSGSC
jgi:NAD-reducing hydrogenase small subunit